MRVVNKEYLLKQSNNFKKDIESVVDMMNGKIESHECWEVTDESNWNSILTFLSDIELYLETVEEDAEYNGDEIEEDDDEYVVEQLDYFVDDTPPEDGDENESETQR